MRRRVYTLLLAAVWSSGMVMAGEAPAYNRIHLQAESSRDIGNDLLSVTLAAEEEHRDAAELANRINAIMGAALQRVRQVSSVRARSGSYQIRPVYDDQGRFRRWRGSQMLQLRGTDVAAVSALVGRLQEHLKIRSLTFSVTDERRRQAETRLTGEALDAFTARAQRVAERLGFSGYRIVELRIDTRGERARPMLLREKARAATSRPLAVEGGQSRMAVTVQGTIELQ